MLSFSLVSHTRSRSLALDLFPITSIIDGSETKMIDTIAFGRKPSASTNTSSNSEENSQSWPFAHKSLIVKGRGVWCASGDIGPKSARSAMPFGVCACV